jgi:hypothetical protein
VHLTEPQLEDLRGIATSTGRDRELDGLLIEFLWETGWRREGVLNCTLDGIDGPAGAARTTMKNGKTQQSPVNSHLLAEIVALAVTRGARHPWDAVFRGRNGRPISAKHFENLSKRLKRHKSWAAPLRIGPHAVRRSTITEVTARHGVAAGIAWANHSRRSGPPILRYLAEPTWEQKRTIAAEVFGPLNAPLPPRPSPADAFAVPYGGPPTTQANSGAPAPPVDARPSDPLDWGATTRPGGPLPPSTPPGTAPRADRRAGPIPSLFRVEDPPAPPPPAPATRRDAAGLAPLFLAPPDGRR